MKTLLYKLGGSLLTLPDLPRRLRELLARRRDARPLLVVGGGAAADVVRDWDRLHSLGEQRSHWLALRSLQLNESLLAELLPEIDVVSTRRQAVQSWDRQRLPLLSAFDFVRAEEAKAGANEDCRIEGLSDCKIEGPNNAALLQSDNPSILQSFNRPPLPHCWDATSDSVAAWIAGCWPADELVLVKSTDVPDGFSIAQAQAKGLVDRCFAEIAAGVLRLGWVNLRTGSPEIFDWK